MAVKVGSVVSETRTLDMGVAQGSVIAPLLFIIILNDIEKTINKSWIHMSLFADDLATWADCPSRRKGAQKCWRERFQNCMNEVENYVEVDGFQLSAEKTVLLVFTSNS